MIKGLINQSIMTAADTKASVLIVELGWCGDDGCVCDGRGWKGNRDCCAPIQLLRWSRRRASKYHRWPTGKSRDGDQPRVGHRFRFHPKPLVWSQSVLRQLRCIAVRNSIPDVADGEPSAV